MCVHFVLYWCCSILNMMPINISFIHLFEVYLYLLWPYVGAISLSVSRELRNISGLKNVSQFTIRKQKPKVNRVCDKHSLYKLS